MCPRLLTVLLETRPVPPPSGANEHRRPGVDDARHRAGTFEFPGPDASIILALLIGNGPARHMGRRRRRAGPGAVHRRHGRKGREIEGGAQRIVQVVGVALHADR